MSTRLAATLLIAKPAATAVGHSDFRILMLKRNNRGLFGSLHVFPGGALDDADSDPKWNDVLGSDERAMMYGPHRSAAIAAVRETFEECGLSLLEPTPAWTDSECTAWRARVHENASAFLELCAQYKTAPSLSALVRWAHWITPAVEKKRFDTQFFLTIIQSDHLSKTANVLAADGAETLTLDWFTPQEAIALFREKKISLFPPQFVLLSELCEMTLADLGDVIAGRKPKWPPIEPYLPIPHFVDGAGPAIVLPGDGAHPEAESKGWRAEQRNRIYLSRGERKSGDAEKTVVGGVAGMRLERNLRDHPNSKL